MSEFKEFGTAVHNAYNSILQKDGGEKKNVFIVDVNNGVEIEDGAETVEGGALWQHYLASFPAGTNKMFRERTEYDCSTCRNFVKNLGAVVYINKGEILTVWDVADQLESETYKTVAKSMAAFVKSLPIKSPFVIGEPAYGAAQTKSDTGEVWNHFHGKVPTIFQWKHNEPDYVGEKKNDVQGLRRSILEISDEAVDIVLDLFDQDSLPKGNEKRPKVELLRKLKRQYGKLKTEREREVFLWLNSAPHTRIYSDVIGTLMVSITQGVDIEDAVKEYEFKTEGANYKRPKALVTQKMIDAAKKTVDKLGIEDSLHRRYATKEDISVNDVLFVDGTVRPTLLGGAFDRIKPTKKESPKFDAVEDISINDFINKVLPKADSLEVFVKNNHMSRLVSLVAPLHADAKPLLKWDNGFSWSYIGEVADAIKQRVKTAGGKVDGDVRVSLAWHNADDLDLHMTSGRAEIYYGSRQQFGATLDIDMNGMDKQDHENPVENIFWSKASDVRKGRYEISVHNYRKASTKNVGFEVQIEILGETYSFDHPKDLGGHRTVNVGTIVSDGNGNITVEGADIVQGGGRAVEEWGIKSQEWVPVDLICRSPNFWNDQKIGTEHIFFMLKGCVNEDSTRGFLNEYLRDELHKDRKAFEVISAQLKAPFSENQLSGIGFSVNNRAELQVRVKGSMTRVLNVKF